MSVKFSTDIEGKKSKKILSVFLVFVLFAVNFFGFSTNTARSADAWYNGGVSWGYRLKVTINNFQIPSTQTNFPVYVDLANLPAVFWSNVKSDGSDIRITNSSGTELAREVVSINTSTSTGELWFKADSISNASYYYIYYGNSGATEPAANSTYGSQKVWDDGGSNYFKGVWHLPSSLSIKYQSPLGGISTASSYYFSRPPSMGFDGITGTIENGWVNNGGTSGSLTYQFSSNTLVTGYKVFPFILANNSLARTPKNWTFEGSNDGTNWTTLDTRTNQTSWTAGAGVTYAFSNSTSYLYYKLNCSVNNGDSYTAIEELQLNYLDNSIASLLDSTSNAKNLTNYGAGATLGRMIGGVSLNGSSQWMSVPSVSLGTVHTASVWVRPNAQTGTYNFGPVLGNTTGTNIDPITVSGATDNNIGYTQGTGGVGVVTSSMTGSWHHIVSVRDGVSVKLYYDGIEATTGSLPSNEALIVGSIGSRNQPGGLFYDGVVDEVHLSTALRSADWIKAEYNNQNSPTSFYSIFAGEIPDNPTNLNSTAGDSQVSLTWDAPSYEGTAPITDYIIEYKPHLDSTWTQFGHVASVATSIDVAGVGLANGALYDFRVSAVSAVGVSNPSAEVSSMPSALPRAPVISTVTSGDTSVSVAFTPMSPAVSTPWYNNAWTYRKKITIDKTKVPNTNQENFPVLVSLTGLSNINANGTDVRFTTADGVTQLAREVESYSSSTLVAWVKVPTLSSSVDTVIYIYYGNSGATEPAANSTYGSQKVWDDGGSNYFKGVWHLKETGVNPQVFDSTSGDRDSTSQAWTPTTGKIDGAGQFSGTSVAVTPFSLGVLHTSSAWVKPTQQTGLAAFGGILNGGGNSIGPLFVEGLESTRIGYSIGSGGVAYDVPSMTGSWHHIVSVRDGVSVKLYYDGNEVVTGNLPANDVANISEIAARIGPQSLYYRGTLDEVHVSTVLRSADWIKTEYNNQSNPDSFYAVASEENVDDATADGGSLVTKYTVTSFPEGITVIGTTSPIIVTGLTNGTPYTFTIVATNSVGDSPASIASDSVIPATVPGEPTAVLATYGNKQVSLLWSAPASDGGNAIVDYIIEYKLTNDLDTPVNWQISADPETPTIVATLATGLVNGTSYDFRITARNAVGNGSSSSPLVSSVPKTIPGKPVITSTVSGDMQVAVNFTPLTNITASDWYNNAWTYRKKITIDKTKVPNTNQENFPVLVSLTGLANINANGTDIRFTSADGTTELAREVESYSSSTLVAWVKVPTLSSSVDTDIYMYYGNSSASSEPAANSTYGKNNVWDTNFKGVWHLKEATGSNATDSTGGANTLTQTGSPTQGVGQIDGSVSGFTSSQYYSGAFSNQPIGNTPITVSGWAKFTNTASAIEIVTQSGINSNNNSTFIYRSASGKAVTEATNGNGIVTGNTTLASGQWYYLVAVMSGTQNFIYVNGASDKTPVNYSAHNMVAGTMYIGKYSNNLPMVGSVDELRVSNVARSADWIATEYNNQSNPASFYAVASEETVSNSATNGGSEITNYIVTSNPGAIIFSSSTSPIIVTGLTNGTPYTFTMTATNMVGQGPSSIASSPVTPAGVPGIPTGLVAAPGNALIDLSWTAPYNNGAEITNFVIEYKLRADSSWTQLGHAVSSATTTTVTDLVNGSLYDFRVSAVNSAGTGSSSDPIISGTPRTVPDQPIITGVARGDGQVTVNFIAPVSDGGSVITNYTITSDPQGIVQTGSTSPIIIGGLTNGTPYTFTVKATNAAGDGPVSTSSISVIPAGVPGKAIGVTAVAGNGQATITFVEPLSDGGSTITGYTVYSNNGGTDLNASSTNLSHIVTGLTNGATYTFTVVAKNDVGNGLASDASVAITLPTVPTMPLNVAAEVKSSSIKLTWSDPTSTGGSAITDYVIEYKLTTGGNWVPFDDGIGIDKFITVIGLSNGTSYDFRVSAKNIIGTSEVSSFVSATPGEPAQVRIMGFPDLTNTSIGTDIKITNEGLIEYEYQYTWCVTIAVDNLCGGGDDVFSASNAKLIEPGHDFDFIATSTVSTPGDYFFHIRVLYGSASSTSFSSFAAVATFPDPPTSVSAVAGNADATVSFTVPASNGGSPIINYTVTSNPGGLIGNGVNTPIVVTGLTNGTAYTFTINATNIVGTGLSSSPPTSPVTPMAVPDVVSSLSASAGDTQVGLFWGAPFSDGGSPITDYVIEYKLSSDTSWSIFADPISILTTATVTGLTNNLSYDFRIKAVNSVGQGPINSVSTNLSSNNTSPVVQTNTGSRSSSGSQIYQPVITNAGTTTINEKNIPAINSNTTSLIKIPKTTPSTTPNTKPNVNEVTATPRENSHITEPIIQKQIPVDNSDENKASSVPWMWISTSSLVVIIFGLIAYIVRRRRMDNQFN